MRYAFTIDWLTALPITFGWMNRRIRRFCRSHEIPLSLMRIMTRVCYGIVVSVVMVNNAETSLAYASVVAGLTLLLLVTPSLATHVGIHCCYYRLLIRSKALVVTAVVTAIRASHGAFVIRWPPYGGRPQPVHCHELAIINEGWRWSPHAIGYYHIEHAAGVHTAYLLAWLGCYVMPREATLRAYYAAHFGLARWHEPRHRCCYAFDEP